MAERLRVRGSYAQDADTLEVTLRVGRTAPLTVRHLAVPGESAVPSLRLDAEGPRTGGAPCRRRTRPGCAAGSPGSR
ncbi:hypothetical protein [Streptomyces sp. NPDC053069]|uniref:hypothetical protein n=1 Tax=Streptomyces sp. NPDC053069 TaxID=3365695 RepID=UPI0037D0E71D